MTRPVLLRLLPWILALSPAVAGASPITIPLPELLGEYRTAGETRIATWSATGLGLDAPGPGRVEMELRILVVSLCGDPSCDLLREPPGPLDTGPLRGAGGVSFDLGVVSVDLLLAAEAFGGLPLSLTVGSPSPSAREIEEWGGITYNGFYGAAGGVSPVLGSPARVTEAFLVLRRVPEPGVLLLVPAGLALLSRRGWRSLET